MARRRRRRNPNDTLLYILGGGALLGVGYLLFSKSSTPALSTGTAPGAITVNSGVPAQPWYSQLGSGISNLFHTSGSSSTVTSGTTDSTDTGGTTDDPFGDGSGSTAGDPSVPDGDSTDF
jgi:hypothetical protein